MFKNIGHFFAVLAHKAVAVAHATPAVIEKVAAIAGEGEAAVEKAEPVVNEIVARIAPQASPVLLAMEHIFGDACQGLIAAGAAADSGFSLPITSDAVAKLKAALLELAGK